MAFEKLLLRYVTWVLISSVKVFVFYLLEVGSSDGDGVNVRK